MQDDTSFEQLQCILSKLQQLQPEWMPANSYGYGMVFQKLTEDGMFLGEIDHFDTYIGTDYSASADYVFTLRVHLIPIAKLKLSSDGEILNDWSDRLWIVNWRSAVHYTWEKTQPKDYS